MKPVAVMTMVIASALMLLILLSCGSFLAGFGGGMRQGCAQHPSSSVCGGQP